MQSYTEEAGNGQKRRVLVVDADSDRHRRKKRIDVLKQFDLKIYPARDMNLARGRCAAGGFDLVVVYAIGDSNEGLAFCDEIKNKNLAQCLLLVDSPSALPGNSEYMVEDDPVRLRDAVKALLGLGEGKKHELPVAA